ncbi:MULTISPECIES: tripartite tricarboxylate transporter permease [unclassified Rhizobium]|uniref:tripartite tricarboxylate transporter permease n=1 Tax=unclassified Rhizobium TaxID=2613769 RepID=UPI001783ED9E|nr:MULTISPECIES: tripartite tricarboxylate transporter permease [unclassified Rhizobium]MBD8687651.1 tripartite tricarboxylate transporter permease [Rhizobium sp. CFBP 13644]MBD8692105.1 tripartite tricarboxylate transporter permease [Rhizobium sp. CFBP 13717]
MDLLSNLALGLETALTPVNLLYCFIGVFLGTLVGVLPGIGALAAISMLFPLTFHLEPTTALIMLAGIYYGTAYGGSTASILLNIPGGTSSAVTCLDGYPMAKQGRAGVALAMTAIGSFYGGIYGIIVLSVFSPLIAGWALSFGSAEYFAMMVLGLVSASAISDGSVVKGLAMVVLGILLATVGMDPQSGSERFTFGSLDVLDGLSISALAMGLFGITEIMISVRKTDTSSLNPKAFNMRSMMPTRDDIRQSWGPMFRSSTIGSFFGALPGTGPSVASFVAYAVEKRISKTPERFGKGAIEGVIAPETANNAADQTGFIPTLSLGIPGSATMALMIGALMVHGIHPGPKLISEQPSLFWGLVMSFWIGNVLLVILNLPLIGLWVRLLSVPYKMLYPAIVMFVCIGAYSVQYSAFDVMVVCGFGFLGYVMRIFGFPAAPLLLGFVLGPLIEQHFRRAMVLARGDITHLVERPITGIILAITAAILIWNVIAALRQRKREKLRFETLATEGRE